MNHSSKGIAVAALILASSVTAKDRLNINDSLATNANIRSNDMRFVLKMQSDCNLALYKGSYALWSSNSGGKGSNCSAVMQNDGNLVVYNSGHHAVWSSNTFKSPGSIAVLQDDGNLVVYQGSKAKWAASSQVAEPTGLKRVTGDSVKELHANEYLDGSFNDHLSDGIRKVVMQTDCNLVLYKERSATTVGANWASDTYHKGRECKAAMQTDGNFVIYSGSGKALWASGRGGAGAHLVFQPDGNLVIYNTAGRATWATGTCGLCGATGPVYWPNGKPNGGSSGSSSPPPALSKPIISVNPTGQGFRVTGSGFTPNATVYVRLVDNNLKNVWRQGSSNLQGSASIDTGAVCEHPGPVAVSANDGRSDPNVTGTLWSNTVISSCP